MRTCILLAAAVGFCAAPLDAQQPASKRPQAVVDLLACRIIQAAEERLKCFDRAAAAFGAASSAGDLVIVDRDEVRAARRSLFGFSLPKLRLFSDRTDERDQNDIVELKSRVKRVVSVSHGKYRVVITDGNAIWETTESSLTPLDPKAGDSVHIKKAALGSYFIRFGSQRWVKGRRVQ